MIFTNVLLFNMEIYFVMFVPLAHSITKTKK